MDKQLLVKAMLENQAKFSKSNVFGGVLGKATELQCRCGGTLHEFDTIGPLIESYKKEAGRPRYAKKARLRKKFEKVWREKPETKMYMGMLLVRPLRNPRGYKCGKCGANHSFYSAIANNLVKIEPMPQGAIPCYFKEPESK